MKHTVYVAVVAVLISGSFVYTMENGLDKQLQPASAGGAADERRAKEEDPYNGWTANELACVFDGGD